MKVFYITKSAFFDLRDVRENESAVTAVMSELCDKASHYDCVMLPPLQGRGWTHVWRLVNSSDGRIVVFHGTWNEFWVERSAALQAAREAQHERRLTEMFPGNVRVAESPESKAKKTVSRIRRVQRSEADRARGAAMRGASGGGNSPGSKKKKA